MQAFAAEAASEVPGVFLVGEAEHDEVAVIAGQMAGELRGVERGGNGAHGGAVIEPADLAGRQRDVVGILALEAAGGEIVTRRGRNHTGSNRKFSVVFPV